MGRLWVVLAVLFGGLVIFLFTAAPSGGNNSKCPPPGNKRHHHPQIGCHEHRGNPTPRPTSRPRPTRTPRPTATRRPVPTPTPAPIPTPTPTPIVVPTITSAEFGVGLAVCDTTDSFFDPDPLDTTVKPMDGWVDAATASMIQGWSTCLANGSWLRADDFVTGWDTAPLRPVMDTQGGTGWVRVDVPSANLQDALKITCTLGNAPQQQFVGVHSVAVKATHTTAARSFVRNWLDRMFRGADIRGHSPYCLAQSYTPGTDLQFEWLQSSGDLVDPGDYDVDVRVCVAEMVGSQRACQQVKSGTTSPPGIYMHTLTTSSVAE